MTVCRNCAKEVEVVSRYYLLLVGNIPVYFCTSDCWDDWMNNPDREWDGGYVVS